MAGMKRIFLLGSMVILLASVAWTTPRPVQQAGAAASEEAHFSGKTAALEAGGAVAGRRRFEAGARTAWHSHPNGQLLFVQEGRARIQKQGQASKDFGPGESDFTAPNIVHWHGATPDSALVHVAVGFGGETRWLEKVTDDEYAGKVQRSK
jgi:quercetin dioxygenase-like cupin family protein